MFRQNKIRDTDEAAKYRGRVRASELDGLASIPGILNFFFIDGVLARRM